MNSTTAGAQQSQAFRYLVLTAQTLFGAWFLIHGLNYWVHFFPQPPGGSGPSNDLLTVLIQTGLFGWIKGIEVIVGVLLLLHRLVPLAIVVGMPVTLSIVHFNLALNHDLFHTVVAVSLLVVNAIIAAGYMHSFKALLAYDAGEPNYSAFLAWLRSPFSGK